MEPLGRLRASRGSRGTDGARTDSRAAIAARTDDPVLEPSRSADRFRSADRSRSSRSCWATDAVLGVAADDDAAVAAGAANARVGAVAPYRELRDWEMERGEEAESRAGTAEAEARWARLRRAEVVEGSVLAAPDEASADGRRDKDDDEAAAAGLTSDARGDEADVLRGDEVEAAASRARSCSAYDEAALGRTPKGEYSARGDPAPTAALEARSEAPGSLRAPLAARVMEGRVDGRLRLSLAEDALRRSMRSPDARTLTVFEISLVMRSVDETADSKLESAVARGTSCCETSRRKHNRELKRFERGGQFMLYKRWSDFITSCGI
jgi:hypothetical protein